MTTQQSTEYPVIDEPSITSGGQVPQEGLKSAATTPGSLDVTFDKDGKLFQGFTTSGGGFATHMATLSNGQVIVVFELWVGKPGFPGFQQFIVVRRYNEDGSLDRTFGGSGGICLTRDSWKMAIVT